MADRLHDVTQRVGFALWQLQELEGATAQYYVGVVEAEPGMGVEAGNALTERALARTFGATISLLTRAKNLPKEDESRFRKLLAERNWLVHNSRSTSRAAIRKGVGISELVTRLDEIADEALALLKVVLRESDLFVRARGIPEARIRELTEKTLRQWHEGETE
jgi:hypothetical protein